MPHFEYEQNETILALSTFDHKWYIAKVVRRKKTNATPSYYVHYVGWNQSWDEWLSDPWRVSKGSKDRTICKKLLEKKRNEQQQLLIMSDNITITTNDSDESMDEYQRNQVIICPLSMEIKQSLYDQFKLIEDKPILLIKLPKHSNNTINSICDKFIEFETELIDKENKLNPNDEKLYLRQIIDSIRYYFNVFIDINLLYESEKKQKLKLLEKNKNMKNMKKMDCCDIYGAEHLFRLLLNLPKIYRNIKEIHPMQAAKISNYVSLFHQYLTKNIQSISVQFDSNKNKNNDGLILN